MTITTQQFGAINLGYYAPSVDGWNTGGVTGGPNGNFNNPDANLPDGFLQFGSMAITGSPLDASAFLVAYVDGIAVSESTGWTQVWNTQNIPGGENGYLYIPTAPTGFVALGVTFTNYGIPNFNVACVAEQYVAQGNTSPIWSTVGIDGGADLALYTVIIDPTQTPPDSDLTSIIPISTSTFVATTTNGSFPSAANLLLQCVGL
ncbi:Vps62-related protein [Undibacterium sp. Di26W]|uniref:Vps62-related protein n=1 Tax=Undibacterium sp. Di26W TaxID=3413035 RepID=UPI003BF068E0